MALGESGYAMIDVVLSAEELPSLRTGDQFYALESDLLIVDGTIVKIGTIHPLHPTSEPRE